MRIFFSTCKCIGTGVVALALIMSIDLFSSSESSIGLFAAAFLVYAACIAVGVIALGLPTHLLFKRFKINSPWLYSLIGMAPPILISLLLKPFGQDPIPDLFIQAGVAGFLGFVCAATFWFSEVRCKHA